MVCHCVERPLHTGRAVLCQRGQHPLHLLDSAGDGAADGQCQRKTGRRCENHGYRHGPLRCRYAAALLPDDLRLAGRLKRDQLVDTGVERRDRLLVLVAEQQRDPGGAVAGGRQFVHARSGRPPARVGRWHYRELGLPRR